MDRATFLRQVGVGLLGAGTALALGGVAAVAALGPALGKARTRWIPVAKLSELPAGQITTVLMKYEVKSGIYTQTGLQARAGLAARRGDHLLQRQLPAPGLHRAVGWPVGASSVAPATAAPLTERQRPGRSAARPLDRYQFKVEADQLLVEVG